LSRPTQGCAVGLRIRGCHPLWPAFPGRSAVQQHTTGLFRFRSPLLAESLLMSFPPGTEMFQFPGFASPHYGFMRRYPKGVGCPIRTSTDQSLLAAPRGFSQRATSFIASWCQGIHRMPFSCSDHEPPCPGTIHAGITPAPKPRTCQPRPRTHDTIASERIAGCGGRTFRTTRVDCNRRAQRRTRT
jgi:hypothetical protein